MSSLLNQVMLTFRPKEGAFMIHTEGMRMPTDLRINIFDSRGLPVSATLNTEAVASDLTKLCIVGLPAGIYHLQLMSQYFVFIKKVILA